MVGFHFSIRTGGVRNLDARDIAIEHVGGETLHTVHIRGSATDQRKRGVRPTFVLGGRNLFSVSGIAQCLDKKACRP